MSKYSNKLCKKYPTVGDVHKATNLKISKERARDLKNIVGGEIK